MQKTLLKFHVGIIIQPLTFIFNHLHQTYNLLYEQQFDTQTGFTETPGGKLSIEQILNGERTAIWETSHPGKSLVKKTIVITDWFYSQGLGLDHNIVKVYENLLNAGFPVYVWSNNQLVPVGDIYELQYTLTTVTLVNQALFRDEMKRLDISHDALYLADLERSHQLVKSLLNPGFIATLYWTDLKTLAAEYLDDLFRMIPDLTTATFKLGESDLDGKGLPDEWYKNISIIEYSHLQQYNHSWKIIQRDIQRNPDIKGIYLSHVKLDKPPQDLMLPASLQSFSAINLNTTWQDIQALLKTCITLQSLSIRSCEDLGKLPQDFQLPVSLTVLKCISNKVTWSELQDIIQACTSLRYLTFANCSNLGKLPQNFLLPTSLEWLSMSFTKVTWIEVRDAIKNCPGLVSLDVSRCKNLGEIPEDFVPPASLEYLQCAYTGLTWKDVQRITQHSPNLRELELGDCKNLGEIPKGLCLPVLKRLNCSSTNITVIDIQNMIQNFPNLKSVDFSDCNNLVEILHHQVFPTLESLVCNGSKLSWMDIHELGSSFPKLKYLELASQYNLGHFPDNFTSFTSLESLCCMMSSLTWEDVQGIIKFCPNLKILDLRCDNLTTLPDGFIFPKGLHVISDFNTSKQNATTNSFIPSDKFELDNSTAPFNTLITVRTRFKAKKNGAPKARDYRLAIYTEIDELSKQLFQTYRDFPAFEGAIYSSANQVEYLYDHTMADSADTFLGRMTLGQGTDDWVALPSLSANDVIDPSQIQLDPPVEFRLAYCMKRALYYLKPATPLKTDTNLTFILTIQDDTHNIPPVTLSKQQKQSLKTLQFNQQGKLNLDGEGLEWLNKETACQAFIAWCSKFKAKKLADNNLNNIDFLNQIFREQAGHCRHRAHVFIAFAKEFGIECRFVSNACHAFIEVLQGNQWVRVDLGSTQVNLKALPFDDQTPDASQKELQLAANNPYKTWDTEPSRSKTLADYAAELLKQGARLPEGKRNLLCTLERAQIDGLHQALLDTSAEQNRRVFFINDLNDVPLQQIVVDNDTGTYRKENSDLMAFLKSARKGDVLLVNWSDYEARHVGFNTIMDSEQRKLKEMLIDKGVTIINLLSHDKKAEMGEDFYSRCRQVSSMPPALNANPVTAPELPLNTIAREICFYDDDWRATLTGALQLTPKGYERSPSPLMNLAANENLVFRNAPWHLPAFRAFLRNMQSSGEVSINGTWQSLKGTAFYRDDRPYDFKNAPLTAVESNAAPLILNSATFQAFFQQYRAENSKLAVTPAYLEQYQKKTLPVLLTSPLTNGQWEKLFTEARKYDVVINLAVAPSVKTPQNFNVHKTVQTGSSKASVHISNDIGYSLKEHDSDLIIPISDKTTLADLIETISSNGGLETLEFKSRKGALSEALLGNRNVILAGNPSLNLMNGLASLFLPEPYILLNGRREFFEGNLRLICNAVDGLEFTNPVSETVSDKMCWESLYKKYPAEQVEKLRHVCDAFIKVSKHPSFDYTQLDSMLNRMTWKPDANPLKHLLRLSPEYARFKPLLEQTWDATKQNTTKKTRLEKVLGELEHAPCVFVAGPSGAGKSHFVHHDLAQHFKILEGLDKLEEFTNQDGQKKCLFIDEANLLHPDAMEIFHGLYHNPPQLLVKGKLLPLPEGCKIIFAGNFGHFKGRREIPFFAQRGHIVTFKALSDKELRTQVMTPILSILFPDTDCKNMEDVFLKTYRRYGDTLSLTARNLEMMALRSKGFSINDLTKAACLCAYDEVRSLLNKEERGEFTDWCETKFKLEKGFLKKSIHNLKQDTNLDSPNFFLTKSRKNPVRLLDALMSIRQNKINNPDLSQKGINAILFEGEPGIGKSLVAMAYLESKGFQNGVNSNAGAPKYYHLTPSAGLDVIHETLHKAFHEGAVVIIDELNTLPLEDILNPMLSGVDTHGKTANNKGFTLITTQNPVTYAKRQPLSEALLNRCQKIDLKNYPLQELTDIMTKLSKHNGFAEIRVSQFSEALQFANKKNLHPKPTPRHLFADAGQVKSAEQSVQEDTNESWYNIQEKRPGS